MSKLPIDIVNFDNKHGFEIENAIKIANEIQSEFIFSKVDSDTKAKFNLLHLEDNHADEFIDGTFEIKQQLQGFYPYLIFISNNPLHDDKWSNLYANTDSEKGISIITTDNVPVFIIPKDKMTSFFVYYFARVILKFLLKGKYNHDNPSKNGCLFDFMEDKKDILKSMRPNAICDDCKKEIRKHELKLSDKQYIALDFLLSKSGDILKESIEKDNKTRIFIGSSTEGLEIARKLKSGLKYDAHVDTWADGIFDVPGKAYIEILEEALDTYDYGIFVFSPDDKIFSRGAKSNIPRDNVIFEYGMFLGRHSRKRAFFIIPRGKDIKLMTDILGITCLDYDPTNPNVQSAVSDACDQIRDLLKNRNN